MKQTSRFDREPVAFAQACADLRNWIILERKMGNSPRIMRWKDHDRFQLWYFFGQVLGCPSC